MRLGSIASLDDGGRFAAILTGMVVILGVIAAPALGRYTGAVRPQWQVVLSAALFGLLVSPAMQSRSAGPVRARGLEQASAQVVGGVAFTMMAIAVLGWWPAALSLLVVILVPAAIEEAIFRHALPLRLAYLLSNATAFERRHSFFLGQVASQILFAACHFVSRDGLWASQGWTEAIRLVAGGALYANLAERRGLWLAIGAHATLNLSLHFSTVLLPRRVDLLTATAAALLGLYGLFTLSRSSASRRSASHATMA